MKEIDLLHVYQALLLAKEHMGQLHNSLVGILAKDLQEGLEDAIGHINCALRGVEYTFGGYDTLRRRLSELEEMEENE